LENEEEICICEPEQGLILGESGEADKGLLESLVGYLDTENVQEILVIESSNEAMEPYGFKTNNLCVNAGFNGDGNPSNDVIKMKDSRRMSLQSIGEGQPQSLVVKEKEQLLNTVVKAKEDMFLLGMKEKQGQYLVRIDEDGQFFSAVIKFDEGFKVKCDDDCL
jgi:hypothetical protein